MGWSVADWSQSCPQGLQRGCIQLGWVAERSRWKGHVCSEDRAVELTYWWLVVVIIVRDRKYGMCEKSYFKCDDVLSVKVVVVVVLIGKYEDIEITV